VNLTVRDRVTAWLATGPVGRVVAFVWDLSAAWGHWALGKVRRR
jgi:hypothetical protein